MRLRLSHRNLEKIVSSNKTIRGWEILNHRRRKDK
jgi:hypothetical protein